MLVVTLASVIIVAATVRLTLVRVEARAQAEVHHEAEKFRDFAERPDPATGQPHAGVADILIGHLQYNLPEHNEAFFSLLDGEPHRRSAHTPLARLDGDAAFVAYAAALETPATGKWETSAGPAMYGIVPLTVAGDPQQGHLVIVVFMVEDYEETRQLLWLMVAIGAIALGGAGLTGWFITGRVLAPIRELQRTAAQITEMDLDGRIEVVGNDDVAGLARTFNSMLDRLAQAFEGQRQFLDDAGHELRTPITIIRGHLEVMGTDPEEQRATLELVNAELLRMGRLIDDLILLARAERPDFVRPRPTNLTELIMETFVKATGLADRQWSLDATPDADAVVDGERLTQALLQLAANAVAHTEEGGAIAVGGRVVQTDSRELLYLWVRDEGVGIAREDQQRIFERFVRAAPGKTRESHSGLGLAIVSSIAQAHGGYVTLESSPGRGSTFTLVLPFREDE